MQSRIDSLMEALTNVAVGFLINFVANAVILPWYFGIPFSFTGFAVLGVIYTVISVARSYLIRRAFNGRTVWQAIKELWNRKGPVSRRRYTYAIKRYCDYVDRVDRYRSGVGSSRDLIP